MVMMISPTRSVNSKKRKRNERKQSEGKENSSKPASDSVSGSRDLRCEEDAQPGDGDGDGDGDASYAHRRELKTHSASRNWIDVGPARHHRLGYVIWDGMAWHGLGFTLGEQGMGMGIGLGGWGLGTENRILDHNDEPGLQNALFKGIRIVVSPSSRAFINSHSFRYVQWNLLAANGKNGKPRVDPNR